MTKKSREHLVTVPPGRLLFSPFEPARVAYRVRQGALLISQIASNGKEVISAVYFPGEIYGGFAAISGAHHQGTGRAPQLAYLVVEPIPGPRLSRQLAEDSALGQAMLATQWEKEAFKDRQLLGMVSESSEQRLASVLLWLRAKSRTEVDEGRHSVPTSSASGPGELTSGPPRLLLSRQELANLAGTSRETITRLFTRFRQQGLVSESRQNLELHPGLLEVASHG